MASDDSYKPKVTDLVRVGYVKNNVTMPLSRLCYALLFNEEEELFPLSKNDVFYKDELGSDDDERDEYYNVYHGPKCKFFFSQLEKFNLKNFNST